MSITFSYVNLLEGATPITFSSEQAGFPASNVLNPFRSKSWRTASGQITNQYIEFDCGYQIRPKTFIITNEQRGIQLSPQAEIRIKGCNDGNWTTPTANVLIPWGETLITKYSTSDFGSCRFWRVEISDTASLEPFLEIGNVFLGDSIDFSSTDLNLDWEYEVLDDSESVVSDGGEAWWDKKAQRSAYRFELNYMSKAERDNLEDLFRMVGKHKPFYINLDPDMKITLAQSELAIYCRFTSGLAFVNPFFGYYNCSLDVEEVL
jgi:hypothetical protein